MRLNFILFLIPVSELFTLWQWLIRNWLAAQAQLTGQSVP